MEGLLSGEAWAKAVTELGEIPGKKRCEAPLSAVSGPVCVTGVTGFLALHLTQQLLERGYTVIGTVRSESNAVKMAPVVALQEKFGKEKLRVAAGVDCLKADSFTAAVKDCVGVFHTASPAVFKVDDPFKELVQPAKLGTESCLMASKAAGSVKRVIVTSSCGAIFNLGSYPWDYQYTAKDWNKTSCPDSEGKLVGVHGYKYSKVVAEKAAWDFQRAEDCPFDVACINPPMIIGQNLNTPKSVDDLNTSSATVLNILKGEQDTQPNSVGWVDVVDVARAHIAAYEHPEAGGRRFLCAADEQLLWTEVAQLLKELRPDCPVKCEPPAAGVGVRVGCDSSPLKGLSGFTFRPLKESFRVQVDALAELGFIPKAQAISSDTPISCWSKFMADADRTIALFGGTGGTGSVFLELALKKGWNVRALVRTPDKVKVADQSKLTLIQGTFEDADKVEQTLQGASYAVCMGGNLSKPYPTDMMLNLVKLMRPLMAKAGTKTFIYQGGALAPLRGETLPCMARTMKCLLGCVIGDSLKDHENVWAYMQDSGMFKESYGTIAARPLTFAQGASKGTLKVAAVPVGGTPTVDVAQFYLDNFDNKSLFGTFPFMAY